MITISFEFLVKVTLLPCFKITSELLESVPVIRIFFSVASIPSTALKENLVSSLGVVTTPPRAIVAPLIVIPEFTRAVFGKLATVLSLPLMTQCSKVLFVTV